MLDTKTIFSIVIYFTLSAAFASSLVTYLFPLLFKNFYNPQSWTKGKFLLFSFAIITIMWGFTVYANYYVKKTISYESVFPIPVGILLLYVPCIIVGFFPTVTVYIVEKRLGEKAKGEETFTNISEGELITFSNNVKESISFSPNDFLYAEVVKNDFTLYYLNGHNIESKTFRMTLLQALDVFSSYPNILRIHRAFVVNIDYVTDVTGNSHGYKLTLKEGGLQLPLSKTYAKEVLEIVAGN
ncbi:MAG: LytTR family transcriptional regulator DNA-binding domain-containing protein [Tannerella sp.]|nr:LytTR family transcriptional regulator DNA-binding domain-containing protein [Tannerella sp.]